MKYSKLRTLLKDATYWERVGSSYRHIQEPVKFYAGENVLIHNHQIVYPNIFDSFKNLFSKDFKKVVEYADEQYFKEQARIKNEIAVVRDRESMLGSIRAAKNSLGTSTTYRTTQTVSPSRYAGTRVEQPVVIVDDSPTIVQIIADVPYQQPVYETPTYTPEPVQETFREAETCSRVFYSAPSSSSYDSDSYSRSSSDYSSSSSSSSDYSSSSSDSSSSSYD